MDKVQLYRRVYESFKGLCAEGKQAVSFSEFCRNNEVDPAQMPSVLKSEFKGLQSLPGYKRRKRKNAASVYADVYENFRNLCAAGNQPGSFSSYCKEFGITRNAMHCYLKRNGLNVVGLPGYVMSHEAQYKNYKEVPFEDVIFEEAGFLPADIGNVITVTVDGHVAVSFPADTDVAAIARFVRKMGKEAGHVGS
uniref:Uncharacterized protein n=1 Tax=uncultured Muribaculaceae bacterium TaxID=2301481 RepID=A0A6G8F3D1_9BACT|nr:hypothetical protein Muribac1_0090 [uncultured Muribaculaceae bacterium]